jgi:enterochelin esterase-like enzyme
MEQVRMSCACNLRKTGLPFATLFPIFLLLTACTQSPGSTDLGGQPPEKNQYAVEAHQSTPQLPIITATESLHPSPIATPTPKPECIETNGRVENAFYRGVVTNQEIPVLVFVPPCYDVDQRNYPVLYLLHGYPYDQTHWLNLGVVQVAESGLVEGRWEPMLIVMPTVPDPIFTQTDGGPKSYEQEFIEGLVPFIDKTFRTIDDKASRGLAGISRGGVWALEISFHNSDKINTVMSLSPAIQMNYARPAYDPIEIVDQQGTLPENILLIAGENEWTRNETVDLANQLERLGYPVELLLLPGEHNDPTWISALDEVLNFAHLSLESAPEG